MDCCVMTAAYSSTRSRQAREKLESPVLEALEDLTAVDSERWIRERGDLDRFVAVILAECGAEVEGLVRGSERSTPG